MKYILFNIKIALILLTTIGLFSCNERGYDNYDAGQTVTVEMNGEWFIDITDEATGATLAQHILHKTYDTSLKDGTMYINDEKQGYSLFGKVNTDINTLTFDVTNETNLADPGTTFTITEGKILKKAAQSRDGNIVDSIYFKGEFSYEPGKIIIFSGHKRTGFLEDEY